MWTRKTRLWLIAATVLFFSQLIIDALADAPSPPTVDDARKAIEDELKDKYRGQLNLLEINKTDGRSGQYMGTPTYKLEFKSTAEARQTLYYSLGKYVPTKVVGVGEPKFFGGKKYTGPGQALFTLKESGWVLSSRVTIANLSPLPDSGRN